MAETRSDPDRRPAAERLLMTNRLLVANRGEIARRVIATCRRLGISTVAVHSDPDAGAAHVREADLAVRLPGAAATDTYLRGDLLVAAALAAGADAVHPGYGFLSERADFARAVLDAGLTWVGPPPEVIAAMGVKPAAKRRMAAAGVPVLPDLDPEALTAADLPVLVKAASGGGGRGMRVVTELAELPAALASARREAEAAFGDPAVFCEPLLRGARHLEVQILADMHGTVWALGERDCSVQRRHQKLIEEAPAPGLDGTTRQRLLTAGRDAATAIGYVGAGTVEFLLGPDGRLAFLEVNTRLQVEHPVTECVTGLDLVRWQLEIAAGGRLPERPPTVRGHAIEVRLYAENPAAGWRPVTGCLHRLEVPGVDGRFSPPGPGATDLLRLDAIAEPTSGELGTGPGSGEPRHGAPRGPATEIGPHYDALLGKLVCWAPTREEAARRLACALAGARIHGIGTNRELLVRVLRHPQFLDGTASTDFLTEHPGLVEPLVDGAGRWLSALAAALAGDAAARDALTAVAPVHARLPIGWRNVPSGSVRTTYRAGGEELEVSYRVDRTGRLAAAGHPDIRVLAASANQVRLEVAGVSYPFTVTAGPPDAGMPAGGRAVEVESPLGPVRLTELPRFADPQSRLAPGSLLAPMPGLLGRLAVAEGDPVRAGQPLMWLEAMKMEHPIVAPADGRVARLPVAAGQQVGLGTVLAVVEASTEPPPAEQPPAEQQAAEQQSNGQQPAEQQPVQQANGRSAPQGAGGSAG